jgi:hypothetical protein
MIFLLLWMSRKDQRFRLLHTTRDEVPGLIVDHDLQIVFPVTTEDEVSPFPELPSQAVNLPP